MASVKSGCSLIGLFLCFGLGNFVQSWPTDEDTCAIEEPIRLQVVFCFDQTQTFQKFLSDFENIAPQLTTELENQFPGSEFGITAFADYPYRELPNSKGIGREDTDTRANLTACYLFHQSLTTDQNLFKEKTKVGGIISTISGGAENSLGGVMFTALDNRVGWNNGDRDKNGVLVEKIIVLVTDQFYSGLLEAPNPARRIARGDGTDTCTNSLPPSISLIGDVLRRKRVSVIGLFAQSRPNSPSVNDLFTNYRGLFDQIGVSFSYFKLDLNNVNTIPRDVEKGVKETITCIWTDPPAYNTLGL